MIKFQVKNFALILDEVTLMVSQFKALVDYDKSPHKDVALRDLLYVYLVADEESPFADIDPMERDRAVRKNVYNDENYCWDPKRIRLVDEALKQYKYLSDTVEGRTLISINQRIAVVQEYMDKDRAITSPKEVSEEVSLVTNVATLIEKAISVKETIAKKGKTKVRNKADASSSPIESGLIRDVNTIREQRAQAAAAKQALPELPFSAVTSDQASYNQDGSAEFADPANPMQSIGALSEQNAELMRNATGSNSWERFQSFQAAGGQTPSMDELAELFKGLTGDEQVAALHRLRDGLPEAMASLRTGLWLPVASDLDEDF